MCQMVAGDLRTGDLRTAEISGQRRLQDKETSGQGDLRTVEISGHFFSGRLHTIFQCKYYFSRTNTIFQDSEDSRTSFAFYWTNAILSYRTVEIPGQVLFFQDILLDELTYFYKGDVDQW